MGSDEKKVVFSPENDDVWQEAKTKEIMNIYHAKTHRNEDGDIVLDNVLGHNMSITLTNLLKNHGNLFLGACLVDGKWTLFVL